MSTVTKVQTRKRKRTAASGDVDAFGLGALFAGALGLVGVLAATRGGGPAEPAAFVVGGVDLSKVDLSRPFFASFSTPPAAPPEKKAAALERLRSAMREFARNLPQLECVPDVDMREGRFLLYVSPAVDPAQRVIRAVSSR